MPATNKDNMPPTRRACGNCGRLGHLNSTCVAPAKAHLKVGIEIEGLWSNISDTRTKSANWHMGESGDGSIRGESGFYASEFQTRPGSLGEAISQLVAIYPDSTNDSCGMHVHVSFSLSDTMLLASEAFMKYFAARWSAWGHAMGINPDSQFWKRLHGENTFCRIPTMADFRRHSDVTYMDRYSQLNFSAYSEHGTVECRMLPMFRDARLGVLAVENLITIFEDFLVGGHVTSELLLDCCKDVVREEIPELTQRHEPLVELELELDVPVYEAPSEISGEVELYPEVSEGATYVPYTVMANLVADRRGYNIVRPMWDSMTHPE